MFYTIDCLKEGFFMNSSISNYGSLAHLREIRNLDEHEQVIAFSLQEGKTELIEQNDADIVQKIHDLASQQLIFCKQTIKNNKFLQHQIPKKSQKKKLSKNLLSLQKKKCEILELKSNAAERLLLLQRRQALYGQETVPSIPNFANRLSELSKRFPELADGCTHFKYVAEIAMGLNKQHLSSEDLTKLRQFADQIENQPEHTELFQAVRNQHYALQTTVDRQVQLFHNLASWMEKERIQNTPFDTWTSEQKLFFLSKAEQIINNPLEAKFNHAHFLQLLQNESNPSPTEYQLGSLLENLWDESTKTSNKKDFWNCAPPFEQRCHQLANTQELKEYLQRCKLEGLRDIISLTHRANSNDASKQHLIVGGGPSGLISALTKKMAGLDCRIIEKRNNQRTPRDNTITLGKGDPKDLELLFFFGIMARFVENNTVSFGHNKPQLIEVKIGDVEEGLLHVLKELHGADPIDYNTSVTAIESTEQGQASVTIQNTSNGVTNILTPATVTIADGYSGKTKNLLGVAKIDLAKPTMIAYSIFKNVQSPEATSTKTIALKYRIKNGIKAGIFLVAMLIYKILKNKSLESAFARVMKAGPSAIFRLPNQDYLIRVFRKQEQNVFAKHREKIKNLDRKMLVLQTKPETSENAHKAVQLQEERNRINSSFESRLQNHANRMHGFLDFLHALYNPQGHRMLNAPATSNANFLVDVQVAKAERNVVSVGNTPFIIRGDASHTTDPYCGYGCKTALEEIQADHNFFNSFSENVNTLELAMLSWGHEFYQQRTINIGLKERVSYRKRTETLTRYTDRAVTNETMSQSDAGRLLRLTETAKHRGGKIIDENDKNFARELQHRFKQHLEEALRLRTLHSNGNNNITKNFGLKLNLKEKILLKHALKQARSDTPYLSPRQMKTFEALCAKLTFHDIPEGWMLALIFKMPMS